MTKYEILPATKRDIEAFFGTSLPMSVRGVVLRADNEPIAIGGVFTKGGVAIGFSEIKDGISRPKKHIIKAALEVQKLLGKYPQVRAFANADEQSAPRFLEYLGFKPTGEHTANGDVYLWKRS